MHDSGNNNCYMEYLMTGAAYVEFIGKPPLGYLKELLA